MTAAALAVVGTRIRTMDPERPWASAIAVADGRIVAVGDDADVRSHCDARTEVLDGRGWHVTPGLTDGHQHLLYGADLTRGVDFDRVADLDTVRARLAAERDRLAPGEWLRGFGLEYAALGGRAYHHEQLVDVTGGHPMLVLALDLHTAFANAEALRRAGITGPREFADGSRIVCDADGRPTGELREFAAVDLVLQAIPAASPAEVLARHTETIRQQNALGITAIHQMDGDPEVLRTFAALEDAGALTLHAAVHNVLAPTDDPAYVEDLLGEAPPRGRRWRADGIKFWLDGVIETGTAWLDGADELGWGAAPNWPSLDHFERLVRRCHDAGRRIATHAVGDRAVREALDIYGRLTGGAGPHRIEHIETAPPSTTARFRPQGITASMQPIHLRWMRSDGSDPWSRRLHPHQCEHALPAGDLSAQGALVVLGSDWPVAPFDPRLGFYAAQLRRSPDVDDPNPVGATRPLSGEQALAGYTVNPARAIGEQDVAGMLRPGLRADLAAWGADLAQCPPHEVLDVPVRLTVCAGEVVHRAD